MTAPLPCYHCGLPVPANTDFKSVVIQEERDFCCPGCQAVAQAIVENGLESYYQHRSERSSNPDELPGFIPDELKLYDRAEVQQPFVRSEGEFSSTQLLIEGITCAACGWLIEKHLANIPGVNSSQLNLSNHRLHVRWDSSKLPLSDILHSIRKIGYAAHPWHPDAVSTQIAQENRVALRKLGLAGLLWMQVMMASMATWPEFNLDLSEAMDGVLRWVSLLLTTPIIFYCSTEFFYGAMRDIRTRHLTMDVSVSLAILGAYFAGIWSTVTGQGELYFDASGMFAFFLLSGRYLERRARERTAAATAQLVNLLPASCLILKEDGQSERILLKDLQLQQQVIVPPGHLIPADGVILSGQSSVDESLLTGEYLPLPRQPGDQVTAGTLNVEGPLTIQVQALGDNTRLSAIVRLLERAQSLKPKFAEFADQVAQWFLISVLLIAAVVGIIWLQIDAARAFWVVLSLLVATCPCALSLATPTALTAATGSLHKLGLLITKGHVLETFKQIDTVIFDKTGTLTEGRLTLKRVECFPSYTHEQAMEWATALENRSEHPIARAFGHSKLIAEDVTSSPGLGLQGSVAGQLMRIGRPDYVCKLSNTPPPAAPTAQGQWLLLGDTQGPIAWFALDDQLRKDAPALLDACRAMGWQTLLLSGDSSPMVHEIAQQLGISDARGSLTPDDKLKVLEQLHQQGHRVLMLGDGVNDVPVLAAADISIAMGSATDLAKTSADAILLSNRLSSLVGAFAIAKKARRIIIENLSWAILYNGLIIPFAAVGWVTPGWAALGMSVSSLLVVLNALRLTAVAEKT
ncbi:heavy metal translocating P-type ATPase [Thiopseudomonas acetoxidans]|uniref:Heavy metal translocating P-type ATPase n=1 Tax=Thiopseudomonas acetoxidans TaxID=3041622 RepID=A0ABT7SL75_9GAMM|nr:heavy metal translocating P-type ATPase [Thiopseudomonas sp. CY1220]MDM7856943.1 heavy metal translocating P-type ATPase [Thiopseudomonas sp. CY1220]